MKQVVYRGLQVLIVLLATHASFADNAYYTENYPKLLSPYLN